MPALSTGVALFVLSTVTKLSAFGREHAPAWDDPLAVEGQLGVATPVGLAGLALDWTPHRVLSLNAGVGRGLFAMQLAAMARVRPFFLTANLAPGIGAGVSRGGTGTWEVMDSRRLRFSQATWVNGEISLELRRGRFHLRPFLGAARRVGSSGCTYVNTMEAPTDRPCSAVDPGQLAIVDDWRTVYYTGVAVGFSVL